MNVEDTVSKLMAQSQQRKEKELIAQEHFDDYKKAANGIFSSPNGQFFAKYWLKDMGLFQSCEGLSHAAIVEQKFKQKFYLRYVRPYLDVATRNAIEGE